ncbi:Predicted nicotinamide N-methyase [Devosia lucknowensis]|uniref:Predicted nicotinamide N-methyase n=2 Tax=Devosia lucknowensis TaxID=1096929 RepID=A0A1Y6G7X2_9HYPH|nr:Predicted nicotinamide N-methyase [Devosia lucknowensis]
MELRTLPFCPEIRLYTPTPQTGLNSWLVAEGLDAAPPYWAYAWGGGAALAIYLRDHREAVAGKTVLDFGAGSGLVAIAALKAGAARVYAVEPDPIAQVAIGLNAAANHVDVTLWHAPVWPDVDLVLAGDVFYTADVVAQTLPLLRRTADAGTPVLVGDPYRRDLPREHLQPIADYAVPDMGGREPVKAGVFALRPGHGGNVSGPLPGNRSRPI